MFIPIEGTTVRTTDRAVLFRFKNYGEIEERWFPRSVVDEGDDVKVGTTELSVAEWFCDQEDLAP